MDGSLLEFFEVYVYYTVFQIADASLAAKVA